MYKCENSLKLPRPLGSIACTLHYDAYGSVQKHAKAKWFLKGVITKAVLIKILRYTYAGGVGHLNYQHLAEPLGKKNVY